MCCNHGPESLKKHNLGDEDSEKVANNIKLLDKNAGLKDKLSTHYKRNKYIKESFEFIDPVKIQIGKAKGVVSYYRRSIAQHMMLIKEKCE